MHLDDEIYVMDVNGKNLRNLTNHPGRDKLPAWSPDGQEIAFSSRRGGDYDIYVMDVDGKNVRQLTEHPDKDLSPAWSPDGQEIVFSSRRGGNYDIYVINADGTNLRQFTNHPADDWAPTFGFNVAFSVSPVGKQATIWGGLKQIHK